MTARPTADAWRALPKEVREREIRDARAKAEHSRRVANIREVAEHPSRAQHYTERWFAAEAMADALALGSR